MKPSKEKEAPVKFTIYLTDEQRRALRIRAIQDGVSATKLVEGLIEEYLQTTEPRRGGVR